MPVDPQRFDAVVAEMERLRNACHADRFDVISGETHEDHRWFADAVVAMLQACRLAGIRRQCASVHAAVGGSRPAGVFPGSTPGTCREGRALSAIARVALMAAPRVVFTIDSLKLGGAERVLLRWAGWCREEGWQVLVITRQGPQRDAYPVPEGVERWVEPRLSASLERLGWFAFPWRLLALRQLLRRYRSDVVVGVTTLPAVKLLLASAGLPLRTVVSERNYPPAKPPSLPWRWLRRFTYPRADLHLVQTVPAGVWLRDHCAVTRQRLLPNPVSWPLPDREPVVSPDDWLPADHPLILAAGTKAHQKGFDRLMPVFAELGRRSPTLHLALLGLAPGRYHGRDQQAELRQALADSPDLQQRLLLAGRERQHGALVCAGHGVRVAIALRGIPQCAAGGDGGRVCLHCQRLPHGAVRSDSPWRERPVAAAPGHNRGLGGRDRDLVDRSGLPPTPWVLALQRCGSDMRRNACGVIF